MKLENDIKLIINYFESSGNNKFNFKPRNEHV